MKGKKDRQAPKPKTAPAPQNKNLIRGLYLVLGLVILIMYVKTVAYDFAIDDKIIIVDNAYVSKGLAGFPGLIGAAFSNNLMVPGVTRPVTMFTHALEVSLFGMNPGPQHLMNVLFYLFLVLRAMDLDQGRAGGIGLAFVRGCTAVCGASGPCGVGGQHQRAG